IAELEVVRQIRRLGARIRGRTSRSERVYVRTYCRLGRGARRIAHRTSHPSRCRAGSEGTSWVGSPRILVRLGEGNISPFSAAARLPGSPCFSGFSRAPWPSTHSGSAPRSRGCGPPEGGSQCQPSRETSAVGPSGIAPRPPPRGTGGPSSDTPRTVPPPPPPHPP